MSLAVSSNDALFGFARAVAKSYFSGQFDVERETAASMRAVRSAEHFIPDDGASERFTTG